MSQGHETEGPGDSGRSAPRLGPAVVVVVAVVAAAIVGWLALRGGDKPPTQLVPRAGAATLTDPLAYDEADASDLAQGATFGLSQPLFAKSPGGVLAAAGRTAHYRSLVEAAVEGSGFDPDIVEAIVFLESGGRPNVIAGDDPARAAGLTQILAETAKNFLGMDVDLPASRRLTTMIAKAHAKGDSEKVQRLQEERRRIDARFDPELAIAGTVRYLETARQRLGRDDLAVVSYHMGIGNLSNVLRAYTGASTDTPTPQLVQDDGLSWVRVFFDSTPANNLTAYRTLARLGDDSPTYYWRVLAAQEIMRLYRDDRDRLAQLDRLHRAKASAEEVLHPPDTTERFRTPAELRAAWADHTLQPLPNDATRLWFTVDPTMGELAPRIGQPKTIYRGLRPEALATLSYIAQRVHALSGATKPLAVTSTVRDDTYQQLLQTRNAEATHGYSLHTTGYTFDLRRRYQSGAQARAFQFTLDNLTDRGLITWVREPAAIHITVSSAAQTLVPLMLQSQRE